MEEISFFILLVGFLAVLLSLNAFRSEMRGRLVKMRALLGDPQQATDAPAKMPTEVEMIAALRAKGYTVEKRAMPYPPKVSPEASPEVSPEISPEVSPEIQPERPPQPSYILDERGVRVPWPEPEKAEPIAAATGQAKEEVAPPVLEKMMAERETRRTALPKRPTAPPQPSWWERFRQQNPDLERFIGENLVSKIGIAITVLGIAFFIKYAVDRDWIGEVGRVLIGVAVAALLMGIAFRLRQGYRAFSSVLTGGGVAVLYLTVSFGFHDYQLFGQTTAFILMVLVTGLSIFLSLFYDRVELAIISVVGGFASPLLLSTGSGNYIVLFSYVLILDTGMLVLAYLKHWRLVTRITFLLTVLLFGGWLSVELSTKLEVPRVGAMVFATLFYAEFLLMNIVGLLRTSRSPNKYEVALALSSSVLYYAAGMLVLDHEDYTRYQGAFSFVLAGAQVLLAWAMWVFEKRENKADVTSVSGELVSFQLLRWLHIGLAVFFVTLAAPAQFDNQSITLFWAIEAVLLAWFFHRTRLAVAHAAAPILLIMATFHLMVDWKEAYQVFRDDTLPVLGHPTVWAGLVLAMAFGASRWLLRNEETDVRWWVIVWPIGAYRNSLTALAAMVLYGVVWMELEYQASERILETGTRTMLFNGYQFLAIALFAFNAWRAKSVVLQYTALCLGVLAALLFLSDFQPALYGGLQLAYEGAAPIGALFTLHYPAVLLAALAGTFTYWVLAQTTQKQGGLYNFGSWALLVLGIYAISSEVYHHVYWGQLGQTFADEFAASEQYWALNRQITKIGLPIAWTVCSFILMFWGMIRKVRMVRVMSLALFALTVAKLFLYDISGASEGGKIAAFLLLGILLLVVSFMYQKIKGWVMEK